MSNKYEIQIVALDKFTKVFQALNKRASQALHPVTTTMRQLAVLGRVMHLPTIGKGIAAVARSAGALVQSLGAAVGPMGMLFGAGALGSIIAVGATLTALTSRWAALTFEVGRTAQTYGFSTQELQRWQGVAKLSKIPVEEATQALAALAQGLRQADIGGAEGAGMRALLAKFGITLKRTKDGTVDTMAALEDLSRAISRVKNPLTQLAIADEFGVGSLLPVLREGPEAIRKLADEAERLGLVQGKAALDWSVKFTESLQRLKGAIEGVGNSIGGTLAPGFIALMDRLTAWITGDTTAQPPRKQSNRLAMGPFAFGSGAGAGAGGSGSASKPRGSWTGLGEITYKPDPRAPSIYASDAEWAKYRALQRGEVDPADKFGTPEFYARLERDIKNGATFSPGLLEALTRRPDQGASAQVDITVNAPPGARVTARSDSPNASVRISRPMPSGSMP